MRKRIKSVTVALAALAALAPGGSVLATASKTSSSTAPEPVSANDTGSAVQQGDQSTPDNAVAAKKKTAKKPGKKHAKKGSVGPAPANDPVGPNDTTTPDTGSAASENTAENAPENASETGPSDGPGGHADAPGQDSQFQGEQP